MADALQIRRYQIVAQFRDGGVNWMFEVETADGQRASLDVRDGEEIPLLLDICRRDWTIFFQRDTQTLTTGWNIPGSKTDH